MALIPCPDCGKECSNEARRCPNCGRPIQIEITRINRFNFALMLCAVLVLLSGFLNGLISLILFMAGAVLFVVLLGVKLRYW